MKPPIIRLAPSGIMSTDREREMVRMFPLWLDLAPMLPSSRRRADLKDPLERALDELERAGMIFEPDPSQLADQLG
jgi:hypothetical protein